MSFAREQELAAQAQTRAAQAETRAAQAEIRAAQAVTHSAQMEGHLHSVLTSRSWRATAPLRLVADALRRIWAAGRAGRLINSIKRRIKSLLRRLGQSALRQPRIRQAALNVLNRMPGVKNRVRTIAHGLASADSMPPPPAAAGNLSPRAARIYADLKRLSARGKADAHRN